LALTPFPRWTSFLMLEGHPTVSFWEIYIHAFTHLWSGCLFSSYWTLYIFSHMYFAHIFSIDKLSLHSAYYFLSCRKCSTALIISDMQIKAIIR
jgi:hypothetical protein